ncbi:uncharacterized protein L203_103233 [Cryptococcus depauperatus CBS 7841]|uniref:Uncharacterized protein n=1 Tax=Cryptococcus depauperatus CBS 7841 TaxID=1295531 RepID=A0AAJ8JTB2_9TREE
MSLQPTSTELVFADYTASNKLLTSTTNYHQTKPSLQDSTELFLSDVEERAGFKVFEKSKAACGAISSKDF